MKSTLIYVLSAVVLSSMVVIGLSGCGSSGTKTIPPLNPAGVYNITYSPATDSINCTVTDTTTGASSATATTLNMGGSTITITSSGYDCSNASTNGGYCTSTITWLQGGKQYDLSGECTPNQCNMDASYMYDEDCSNSNFPSCTATMTIDENVTVTTTQMNGTATLGTISYNGILANGDSFTANCNFVTNPLTISGTKQ